MISVKQKKEISSHGPKIPHASTIPQLMAKAARGCIREILLSCPGNPLLSRNLSFISLQVCNISCSALLFGYQVYQALDHHLIPKCSLREGWSGFATFLTLVWERFSWVILCVIWVFNLVKISAVNCQSPNSETRIWLEIKRHTQV